MTDKILVTNRTAMTEKYGEKGLRKVAAAARALIAADRRRGVATALIFLDDRAALRKLGGRAVTDFKSGREYKEAVDAIYAALQPEYIVILDAPDIVPHVSLNNPTAEDDDPDVPSDLPYACDAPFSRDARQYLAVTRVVGRIPGIQGARQPTFLIKALKAAASHKPRPQRDY